MFKIKVIVNRELLTPLNVFSGKFLFSKLKMKPKMYKSKSEKVLALQLL